MTASPLLPPGAARHMAEAEATDAELSRMTELALGRGARAIAIGRAQMTRRLLWSTPWRPERTLAFAAIR